MADTLDLAEELLGKGQLINGEVVTRFLQGSHDIRVTAARFLLDEDGAPSQHLAHSSIYECVTCKTGFMHSAVHGEYRSPHPCPELELVWELIESQKRGESDGESARVHP